MQLSKARIQEHNQPLLASHQLRLNLLSEELSERGVAVRDLIQRLVDFQVAIPSWALGTGGTRFGRYAGVGEPQSLEQKIEDVGLLHALNRSSGAISLHIPWDIPENAAHIKALMQEHDLAFDAMNSNTFQDQRDQQHSYKFGSLSHTDAAVRKQAVEHNLEVIRYGEELGSKALTVWLADGSSFPGQRNFRTVLQNTYESLREIYAALPADWKVFVEYKPFEPYFYSTVIQDWGTSFLLANKLGDKAYTLVDLGHHLPNANIEQIVATLLMEGKLGGFHFNDSKYADDDLTVGSIKPYQLYLIFLELVHGMDDPQTNNPPISYMIDASHNLKDPLEDLLQSVEAIQLAYAQALLVDKQALEAARADNDVVGAQEILQNAFRTDVRPLVREAFRQAGGALDPLGLYRKLDVRRQLYDERGVGIATGL
ncbi:L-rhamnose isomerase / sugar isomerase [Catalinimonas alkaloidigena]|uniref:L-rhamnose isomerase / sugar isomerase n=1 Tax=Catalinimonas alkaloidigena TaxID=1075417 RepID=A0A1G9KRQ0_9BACT|nr:TIM barrel protein [Catalinimonas alkaloidigena]SDL51985.1 L-rhamnose isomerase / sugar isomerase [Catalinimonas alkaloidigena]